MLRFIHIAALDGVFVDVPDLLSHHRIRLDEFGLIPLLPDLIASILFVGFFVELKLLEQCVGLLFLQVFEALDQDRHALLTGEYGQPVEDGAGEEVGMGGFVDFVLASSYDAVTVFSLL